MYTRSVVPLEFATSPHSLGAPRIRIRARIAQIFGETETHHGAAHEQLIVDDVAVESVEGAPAGFEVATKIFVAIRTGDADGLAAPVPFVVDTQARFQGEYIDSADAYVTQDNPGLAVLHFTHHPAGFVQYPLDANGQGGETYS